VLHVLPKEPLDGVSVADWLAAVLAAELGGPPVMFVTYDKRLLSAASAAGMPTASPGM
jgi:hypothetical protein